jgi:hypothetical protein
MSDLMSGTEDAMLQQMDLNLSQLSSTIADMRQLIAQMRMARRLNPRQGGSNCIPIHPDPKFREFVDNHHRAAMLEIALRISERSSSILRPSRDEKRVKSQMIEWFARYWDQARPAGERS